MIRVPTALVDAAVRELAVVADALDDLDDHVDAGDLGSTDVQDALGALRASDTVVRAGVRQQARTLQVYCDATLQLARDADATVITGRAP